MLVMEMDSDTVYLAVRPTMLMQVPLSAIEQRRKARLEYNRLYTRTHCKMSNYRDPDRHACRLLPGLA